MRKSRVIRIIKYVYDGPPPGNPGGRERRRGDRPSFSFSGKGREEGERVGGVRRGGASTIRFDKNVKDQRDPARRGRISRRKRDVSDPYNEKSDEDTRRRYFQIQSRNSRRFSRLFS